MSGTPPTATVRGRVLLVDDSSRAPSFARVIEAAGHHVGIAGPGPVALQRLREQTWDAVINDISAPTSDPLALLRAIQGEQQDLPVIVMTDTASLQSAEQAIEYGAFRYLQKPIEETRLHHLLEQAVARGRRLRHESELLARSRQEREASAALLALPGQFETAMESLRMAYQPIVRWSSRSVFAYEALARSDEPALNLPRALLETARQLGHSRRLGRAMRQLAPGALTDESSLLFVNLAADDLEDPVLFDATTPLGRIAHRTALEITECAALDAVDDVPGRVKRLRQMGFRILLDDVGTGYADLSSLTRLEPDIIKLSVSLVHDLQWSKTRQRLVRSMVSLSEGLGALLIAEGIETVDERQTLSDLGCDYMQGFLFARPGPPFPEPTFPDGEVAP